MAGRSRAFWRAMIAVPIAFIGQFGLSVGLIAWASSYPWPLTASLSTLFASVLVAAELGSKVIPPTDSEELSRARKYAVRTLLVVAELSLVASAFQFGRYTQPGPAEYPFTAVSSSGRVIPSKIAPSDQAAVRRLLAPGESVSVDCYVKGEDGHPWYRLSGRGGWLRDDQAIPEEHTGAGPVPSCPD
jgi:hypothetical protein